MSLYDAGNGLKHLPKWELARHLGCIRPVAAHCAINLCINVIEMNLEFVYICYNCDSSSNVGELVTCMVRG
jgi:hypothetical protein